MSNLSDVFCILLAYVTIIFPLLFLLIPEFVYAVIAAFGVALVALVGEHDRQLLLAEKTVVIFQ